jgi:hypothetical protein
LSLGLRQFGGLVEIEKERDCVAKLIFSKESLKLVSAVVDSGYIISDALEIVGSQLPGLPAQPHEPIYC